MGKTAASRPATLPPAGSHASTEGGGAPGLLIASRVTAPPDRAACKQIRFEVFVDEQAVPADIEIDEYEDVALHFLGRLEGEAVATARVVWQDFETAKIGRVAVRRTARGMGFGAAMMRAVEADAEVSRARVLVLEAQTHALGFYERLGYAASGAEFMDAGIPHRTMTKLRG